ILSNGSASNTVSSAAVDRIVVNGHGGDDTISFTTKPSGVSYLDRLDKLNVPVSFDGGAGNDVLTYTGNGDVSMVGGAGNDTLTSVGSGRATLKGDAGNDTLTGGTGNDTLIGGA